MKGTKHFEMCEWVDFVRELGEDAQRRAMDAHLSSGCRRCRQIVDRLRSFATMATLEVQYEPSAEAVRRAEAIFVEHASAMAPSNAHGPLENIRRKPLRTSGNSRKISIRRRALAV